MDIGQQLQNTGQAMADIGNMVLKYTLLLWLLGFIALVFIILGIVFAVKSSSVNTRITNIKAELKKLKVELNICKRNKDVDGFDRMTNDYETKKDELTTYKYSKLQNSKRSKIFFIIVGVCVILQICIGFKMKSEISRIQDYYSSVGSDTINNLGTNSGGYPANDNLNNYVNENDFSEYNWNY